MNKNSRLYLASQSPRRAELLAQVGIAFERITLEVDETPGSNESPEDYVQRVAIDKAKAGWSKLAASGLPLLPVLGADTAVILNGQIMGKPADKAQGIAMLSVLSGQTHQVLSAVCFCFDGHRRSVLTSTDVTFRQISDNEIQQYWSTGEPIGKAGAYAIQGRGAVFVERINGSYSAVVGLPLLETDQLLQKIEQDGVL